MPDDADELILQMQHLAAQARESQQARALAGSGDRLKSAAQKVAWEAQKEVAAAEADEQSGEEKLARAKQPGMPVMEAAALIREGKALLEGCQTRAVKARAKLNFALDKLSEAERAEYEAFHAEVRAETHGQMAEDPLFNKG